MPMGYLNVVSAQGGGGGGGTIIVHPWVMNVVATSSSVSVVVQTLVKLQ